MNQTSDGLLLPDFSRMVSIIGPFEQKTAATAYLEIKRLAKLSDQPITLRIASSGGDMQAFWLLERAFKIRDGKGARFRFVTYTQNAASSAAAYLLVRGHAAYAGQNASIAFHGIRYGNLQKLRSIKREAAFAIAMRLETKNRRVAIKLAKAMMPRVTRKFQKWGQKAPGQTAESGDSLAQLRRFVKALGARMTNDHGQILVADSLAQVEAIWPMAVQFRAKLSVLSPKSNQLAADARIMKAALASKIKRQHESGAALDETAIIEVILDFLLFKDILANDYGMAIRRIIGRLGSSVLSSGETTAYTKLAQKAPLAARKYLSRCAEPRLLALWLFSLALCRRLMMGESKLTAHDAHELCLIDGVWTPDVHHPVGPPLRPLPAADKK